MAVRFSLGSTSYTGVIVSAHHAQVMAIGSWFFRSTMKDHDRSEVYFAITVWPRHADFPKKFLASLESIGRRLQVTGFVAQQAPLMPEEYHICFSAPSSAIDVVLGTLMAKLPRLKCFSVLPRSQFRGAQDTGSIEQE